MSWKTAVRFWVLVWSAWLVAGDYRLGLHTHLGYPEDLSRALDAWNARVGRPSAGWTDMNLDALIAHAERFRPSLLVHGGLTWEMRAERFRLAAPYSPEDRTLALTSTRGLRPGEWLFVGDALLIIEEIGVNGAVHGRRYGGDLAVFPAGTRVTVYRSAASPRSLDALRRYRGGPVLAQMSVSPAPGAMPGYFTDRAGKTRPNWSLPGNRDNSGYLYANPRYRPPALFSNAAKGVSAKDASDSPGLDAFMRAQFRQYTASIATAGRQNGGSKIAYWLPGNEPDSMMPVDPAFYARWIALLGETLEGLGEPGKVVLANVNGANAHFDVWLSELRDAFADLIAAGALQGDRPPFAAAAITFYLQPFSFEPEPLDRQTRALKNGIEAIRALFDNPPILDYLVKELALQDVSAAERERLGLPPWPFAPGAPLRDETRALLRRNISHLRDLGYGHIVWFNQMPSGAHHGDLLEDAIHARETPLGAFLRALNSAAPRPAALTVSAQAGVVHWRARFRKTALGFHQGPFQTWLRRADGFAEMVGHGQFTMEEGANQFEAGGSFSHKPRPGDRLELRFDPDLTDFRNAFQDSVLLAPRPVAVSGKSDFIVDEALRSYLVERYDRDGDGLISAAEADDVRHLDISNVPARTLAGIELFRNMTALRIVNAPVEFMPSLANFTELRSLFIQETELTAYPVMPARLESLTLVGNRRSAPPDLTNAVSLNAAHFADMDWGRLPTPPIRLNSLAIDGLGLVSLDDLANARLASLAIANETLPDLSALASLTRLTDLTLQWVTFGSLASAPTNLRRLEVAGSGLPEHPDLSALGVLESLQWRAGALRTLNAANLPPNLIELGLSSNNLTELPDLSGLSRLARLDVSNNALAVIEPDVWPAGLTHLTLSHNQLAEIPGFPNGSALASLRCSNNRLTRLPDLRPAQKLETLDCSNNLLTEFPDVSYNDVLSFLNCRMNAIGRSECLHWKRINAQNRWTAIVGRSQVNRFIFDPQLSGDWNCDDTPSDPDAEPIRTASATWRGDEIALTWSGGAIRDMRPETYRVEEIAGELTQLAEGLAATRFHIPAANRSQPRRFRVTWGPPGELPTSEVSLTAQPPSDDLHRYALLHAPHVPQWRTAVSLANPGASAAAVSLTAYDAAGAALEETPLLVLPSGQGVETALDELFDSGLWPDLAWVGVQSDRPLNAVHNIGLSSEPTIAETPLHGAVGLEGRLFAKTPAPGNWTGLVFLNPGDKRLTATLERRGHFGELLAQTTLALAPGEKQVGLLDVFFQSSPVAPTHLSWRADAPLQALALSGDLVPWTQMSGETASGVHTCKGVIPLVEHGSRMVLYNASALVNLVTIIGGGTRKQIWIYPHGHAEIDIAALLPGFDRGALHLESDAPIQGHAVLNRQDSDFGLAYSETVPLASSLGRRFLAGPIPRSLDWRTTLFVAFQDEESAQGAVVFRARDDAGAELGQVAIPAVGERGLIVFDIQDAFPQFPDLAAVEIAADKPATVYRLNVSIERPGLMRGAPVPPTR